MPVKLFLSFAVLITALHTMGQKIEIKHLAAYNEDSKIIYTGVENNFLIIGAFDQVKTDADVKSYRLHNDTLIITPLREGNMPLSFITKAGTQQVVFTTKRLPLPVINLGGASKFISKENCRKNNQLTLLANDIFFEHFNVDSSVVTINGQIFICKGNTLSNGALKAIDETKPGDKLDFTYVRAVENKSGRKIAIQTSFLIK